MTSSLFKTYQLNLFLYFFFPPSHQSFSLFSYEIFLIRKQKSSQLDKSQIWTKKKKTKPNPKNTPKSPKKSNKPSFYHKTKGFATKVMIVWKFFCLNLTQISLIWYLLIQALGKNDDQLSILSVTCSFLQCHGSCLFCRQGSADLLNHSSCWNCCKTLIFFCTFVLFSEPLCWKSSCPSHLHLIPRLL